jgi:hypothetical protein
MSVSYTTDIRPLFRPADIQCMSRMGMHLGDPNWMCDRDRAQAVYDKVSTGAMPPDKPWPAEWVTLFKQWMDEGRQR